MTPGALAFALIPFLEDAPGAQHCLSQFAIAATGVDAMDPGPPQCRSKEVASRACRLLRGMRNKISEWSLQQWAQFLCQQSYDLLCVHPQALVQHMLAKGCLRLSEDGRFVFNEVVLARIPEPCKRCFWKFSDFELLQTQHSVVDLGEMDVATQISSHLIKEGLMNIKNFWLRDALIELGVNAPGLCALEAKLVGVRVALTMSALGTKEATNSVAQVVRQKAQAYFAQIHRGYFRSCKREHIQKKREAAIIERQRRNREYILERERQQKKYKLRQQLREIRRAIEAEHSLAVKVTLIEQLITFCKNLMRKLTSMNEVLYITYHVATFQLFDRVGVDVPLTVSDIPWTLERLVALLDRYVRDIDIRKMTMANLEEQVLAELVQLY
jgi:hypothetical protein